MDPPISVGEFVEVILLDDFFGNEGYVNFHVFGSIKRCVEIEVLYVPTHHSSISGGDDGVCVGFKCCEVGRGRAGVARVFDEISANGESRSFFFLFVWFELTHKFAISDRAVLWDLGFRDEVMVLVPTMRVPTPWARRPNSLADEWRQDSL